MENVITDTNAYLEEIGRESQIRQLIENLRMADIRCITSKELIQRLTRMWEDLASNDVITTLLQRQLSSEEEVDLERLLRDFQEQAAVASSRKRQRIDYTIFRLLPLLPRFIASDFALSWLGDHRKSRRELALKTFKRLPVDPQTAERLLSRFRQTNDETFLEIIARSSDAVPKLDAELLLQNLSHPYWKMRIIEALLLSGDSRAIPLSREYPFEFVYASGRLQRRESLPIMGGLLQDNKDNLGFLSIYAWALGRLRARAEFEEFCEQLPPEIFDCVREFLGKW